MKTVKYVAYGNCKVKVGGVEYSGTMVIPTSGENGLSDKDIERLLKDRFIRKVELDEGDGTIKSALVETLKSTDELLKKAKKLGIKVTKGMAVDELSRLVAEAEAKTPPNRTDLLAKAASLGIPDITDATPDEEIQRLVAEAEAKA
jgi:hypothetical protein